MEAVKIHPEFIIDEKGAKKAVILPINEYEELMEDLHDLAIITERKLDKTISHDQVLQDLRKDGILPS